MLEKEILLERKKEEEEEELIERDEKSHIFYSYTSF